jgi:hypothetical protein
LVVERATSCELLPVRMCAVRSPLMLRPRRNSARFVQLSERKETPWKTRNANTKPVIVLEQTFDRMATVRIPARRKRWPEANAPAATRSASELIYSAGCSLCAGEPAAQSGLIDRILNASFPPRHFAFGTHSRAHHRLLEKRAIFRSNTPKARVEFSRIGGPGAESA